MRQKCVHKKSDFDRFIVKLFQIILVQTYSTFYYSYKYKLLFDDTVAVTSKKNMSNKFAFCKDFELILNAISSAVVVCGIE